MPPEKLDITMPIVGASIFILLLVIAGALLFRIYLKRKHRLYLEKERLSVEFEQTLLRSKLEIQEDTFTHISREIHDNIGQVLSLVRINLNTIDSTNGNEEKISRMDDLMGKAITDLRNLSHSLDTDLIRSTGWSKATERLFLDIQRSGKFKVTLSISEDLPPLGNDRTIILFRMIQEISNNILRHSAADHIWFTVTTQEKNIIIEIKDNGKGFELANAKAGAGLKNLYSRSRMINADLLIESAPGQGTSIQININVNPHG